MEYNSIAWNPFLIKDIKTLEAVERRFTKWTPEMKHLTYYQRLSKLKLESLELRRLLFAYKLVFGMLDMNVADFFITNFNSARRGHCYKLYLPSCKSSIRCSYFGNRVIRVWNSLSDDIDFTSYVAFNQSLTGVITARCTLVQSAVLRSHVVRLSVCLSVTLVDQDHIRWKSRKLIARTSSPTPSLFVAQRTST